MPPASGRRRASATTRSAASAADDLAGGETTEDSGFCFRNLVSHPEQLRPSAPTAACRAGVASRSVHGADAWCRDKQRGGDGQRRYISRVGGPLPGFGERDERVYERPRCSTFTARSRPRARYQRANRCLRRRPALLPRSDAVEVRGRDSNPAAADAMQDIRYADGDAPRNRTPAASPARCTCDSTRRRELDRVENTPAHTQGTTLRTRRVGVRGPDVGLINESSV
jgi:hypothetical protein